KHSPESTPRLYPILSLQTLLYVTGIQPHELEIIPGEKVITPPLFGVFKDSNNQLQVLNPGVSFNQVEDILIKKKSILNLTQNVDPLNVSQKSLDISQPIKITHTNDGIGAFILDAQEILPPLLKLLCDTSLIPKILALKKSGEEFNLDPNHLASWDKSEAMYRIDDIEDEEEYYFHKRTFEVILENRNQIQDLNLNKSITLIEKHDLRWNSYLKKYISNLAGFANNSVQDIAQHNLEDFTSLAIGDTLRIGNSLEIPIDENGRLVVSYLGQFNTKEAYKPFKTISYYDVWAKRIDPSFYAGKIFILGSTAPALFDYISAPAESVYPGVMLHANLISSMLNDNFLSETNEDNEFILIALAALIGALIGVSFNPFIGTVITAILAVIWFLFHFFVFQDQNFNLGFVRPQIANFLSFALGVLLLYFLETKQRKKTEGYFKNYISPELIDMMLESDEPLQLGGEEGILSAYFTDIASFSTFSEKIGSPTKLVELLNEYLTAMTDILIEEQGTLDKYEGDAIIAFFGAPVHLENHAEASISSAIAMQNKLNELRALWKSQGDKWPVIVHDMRMRIGINSGPIVTGNMGSNVRMNYTMMGDTVNLAARLESGAKQYGVFTMTSAETIKLGGNKFLYRKIDLIRVVGKNEPVEVYEVLDFKDKASDKLKELVKKFEKAWELYKACNWHLAEDLFMECLELEPHNPKWAPGCKTTPSHVFLGRIEAFKKTPPTQNNDEWDGIYTATEK
ncbi:adenylate/guanylate cyclase domain-containing protein, partial [bacterium]|nr:adenylate/guanylate cyclase domain-containing protein [bacterium]